MTADATGTMTTEAFYDMSHSTTSTIKTGNLCNQWVGCGHVFTVNTFCGSCSCGAIRIEPIEASSQTVWGVRL